MINTQEELNALYSSCFCVTPGSDPYLGGEILDGIDTDRYHEKLEELGAERVIYDWRDIDAAGDQFARLLRRHGFTVLLDPMADGSDTYAWVVIHPQRAGGK